MKKLKYVKLFENFDNQEARVKEVSDRIKKLGCAGSDFPVSIITGNSGKGLSSGETSGYISGNNVGVAFTLRGFTITLRNDKSNDKSNLVEIDKFGDTSWMQNEPGSYGNLGEITKDLINLYTAFVNPKASFLSLIPLFYEISNKIDIALNEYNIK